MTRILRGILDGARGDDADVTRGQLRLDPDPFLKVAAEPVQERDDDGATGLDRAHQLPPARAIHGAAAGHVGENQVLAYAVVRIRTSPRARLGWQRGCPTGCASWKSQGKTCGILPSKPWRTAPVATTPCPSTVWSRCWRSWKRPGRRIFSILPSAQGGLSSGLVTHVPRVGDSPSP